MKTAASIVALLVASLACLSQASDVLLPGTHVSGKPDVVLIFVQGASLAASRYTANVQAIQAEVSSLYDITVWAAIPSIIGDVPATDGLVDVGIARVLAALRAEGAPTTAPLFIAGHSLGGARAIDYCSNHSGVTGLLMFGAGMLRIYNNSFPVPFVGINGEMDGLFRVSRVAEALYRGVLSTADQQSAALSSGVVVLQGVDHLQFADGTNPPPLVKAQDLKAQVSMEVARAGIAQAAAAFIAVHTTSNAKAVTLLRNLVLQQTAPFLAPLVDTLLNQEASVHFRPSCNSDHPSPQCPFYPAWPKQDNPRTPSTDTDCTCQIQWAATASVTMAGLPKGYSIEQVNAIHDVSDIKPFHHPHLWNKCSGTPCVLNLTTVGQLIYPTLDDFDAGFFPTTASEIRLKMKSRQAQYIGSSYEPNAQLNVTDAPSICQQINQQAVEYALNAVSAVTRQRFATYGQQISCAADDVSLPIGPLWINNPLKLDEVQENGEWVLRVTSISMMTDVDTLTVADAEGYHYCKLLSPGRAMEWIYTDGLRRKLGLATVTESINIVDAQ